MDNLFSARLREARKKAGLKQLEVAEKLKVSEVTVSRWENGKREPSGADISRLAKLFKCNLDFLFTGVDTTSDTHDYILLPRYNVEASAGNGSLVGEEHIVENIPFSETWLRTTIGALPHDIAVISTIGDSMEPTLRAGDLLLIDRSINEIRESAIYAIVVDGALMIKRVQKAPGGSLIVKSDNPAYDNMTYMHENVCEISVSGRMVGAWRRF